jgi:protein involved in polysaccharide export with SLBB domain
MSELSRLPTNGENGRPAPVDLARVLDADPAADLLLRSGDKLYVQGEEEWVTVEGEVRFPGAYPVEAGLTLKDLIEKAQLTSTASLAQASLIRQVQYGARDEEDAVLKRLQSIPRSQLTDGERALLTVKTQEVPGRLPVDFVKLFEEGNLSQNILLKGGDLVRVPQFVHSVLVNGAVLAPAAIPYDSTFTISDYIARAGGFSDRAKKRDVVIVQGSTGHSVKATKVSRIAPGDAVYVPLKSPGQGWRIFRETLVVVTQIATLILIIQNTRK